MTRFFEPYEPELLPELSDIKRLYRHRRKVEIKTHPLFPNKVIEVSEKAPCLLCGKQHNDDSEIEKKHDNLVASGVIDAMRRAAENNEHRY